MRTTPLRASPSPSRSARLLGLLLPLALAAGETWAQKRLPNLTYKPEQLFKILTRLPDGNSIGTDPHHQGYLVAPGMQLFRIFDISDPVNPIVVGEYSGGKSIIPHAMSHAEIGGRQLMACAYNQGVGVYDLTDIKAPERLGSLVVPTTGPLGNDDHGVFWVPPYIYVAGEYAGLSVIDASDPRNLKRVKHVTNKEMGMGNVGPINIVGNLLVMSGNHNDHGVVVMDVSNPVEPVLLAVNKEYKPPSYDLQIYRDKIFYATTSMFDKNGNMSEAEGHLAVYDIKDFTKPTWRSHFRMGDRTETMSPQEDFMHIASSRTGGGYRKVDIRNTDSMKVVGHINLWANKFGDTPDFLAVLGNLVSVADVDGRGTVLVPHQAEPDKTPPKVDMVNPRDKTTRQAVTGRVGVVFTDAIDLRSVTKSTFIVRPKGGAALEGVYSYQSNIVNFSPAQSLKPNTVYEVEVTKNGITDLVGNAVQEAFLSSFTTGAAGAPTGLVPGFRAPPSPYAPELAGAFRKGHFEMTVTVKNPSPRDYWTLDIVDGLGRALASFSVASAEGTQRFSWKSPGKGRGPAFAVLSMNGLPRKRLPLRRP